MSTIVAGTDGSPGSDRAVAFAASLCKALGAQLVLATAAEPRDTEEMAAFRRAERATVGDLLEANCDAVLSQAKQVAVRAGAREVAMRRSVGDPTAFILAVAQDAGAQAIVVGKRGRGRLAGLLVGSVSQKLVSVSSVPVIVVP